MWDDTMPLRLTIAVAIEKLSVLCYQHNIIEQELSIPTPYWTTGRAGTRN